ncbi:hypothetical protein D3C71_1419840 [compost metagenome]
MAVVMKRSTKIAPDSLSTSYLIGSEFIGISMTTLKASGTFLPGGTLLRDMSLESGLLTVTREAADADTAQRTVGINPDFRRTPLSARLQTGVCL